MNDVAPPLYGDGLPIASVHHHQQQQHPAEDANVKRFELEPVRESARGTDRGVTIQRTAAEKQRRLQWQIQESHLLSLFLPLSLSLCNQPNRQEHELRVETRPGHAVIVAVSG